MESGGTKRSAAKSSPSILKRSRGETGGERVKRKESSRVGFWEPSELERGEVEGGEGIEKRKGIERTESRMETDGNGSECKNTGGGTEDSNTTTDSGTRVDEAGPSSSTTKQREGEEERKINVEEVASNIAAALRENTTETEKGKGKENGTTKSTTISTTSRTNPTNNNSNNTNVNNNKGKQAQKQELELKEITVVDMYPEIKPYEKDETTEQITVDSEKANKVGVEVEGEFGGEVKQPKTDRMVRKEIVRVGVVAVIVLVVVLVFVFK